MQDFRPEYTYTAVVFAVFALLVWVGCVDVTLYLNDNLTISQWLRTNPRYFVYPMAMMLTFIGLLTIHLFSK